MGSDGLFWKRKKHHLKRKIGTRGEPKQTFLIVCEGERTELSYFKSFKVTSANIKVEGIGYNTYTLVKRTIEIMNIEKKNGVYYDQVWSVFDRNDFSAQNFNNAFELANKNNIHIAYSNNAFELWYLLHFQYFDSAILRGDYISKLSCLLGYKYSKKSKTIYEEILDKQPIAIQNAKKLIERYSNNFNPEKSNPSTTVYMLVEELNKYL